MAKKIALANGNSIEVPEDFKRDDRNLIKINLVYHGDTEGIWAWISKEDREELWETDYIGREYHVALTANAALLGIPWGCFVPIQYRGKQRPMCSKSWLDLTAEPCMMEDRNE